MVIPHVESDWVSPSSLSAWLLFLIYISASSWDGEQISETLNLKGRDVCFSSWFLKFHLFVLLL